MMGMSLSFYAHLPCAEVSCPERGTLLWAWGFQRGKGALLPYPFIFSPSPVQSALIARKLQWTGEGGVGAEHSASSKDHL